MNLIIGRWKFFALTFIIIYPVFFLYWQFCNPLSFPLPVSLYPFSSKHGQFFSSPEQGLLRGKITRAKNWMALDSVTSQFFTILEPITTASFLSSFSIIHGHDKHSSKPVPRHFNLANNSSQIMTIYNLSINQGNTEYPQGINKCFYYSNLFLFLRCHDHTNNIIAPTSGLQTTRN